MISYYTFFYAKLKEAITLRNVSFKCKYSLPVVAILQLLIKQGYVKDYYRLKDISECGSYISRRKRKRQHFNKCLVEVNLYTSGGGSSLKDFTNYSTPGRSIFVSYCDLHKYCRLKSLLVLSTPQGLLTGQEAIKKKVGGKLLFRIT